MSLFAIRVDKLKVDLYKDMQDGDKKKIDDRIKAVQARYQAHPGLPHDAFTLVIMNEHRRLVNYIKNGGSVADVDPETGWLPIHYGCHLVHVECVKALLDHGKLRNFYLIPRTLTRTSTIPFCFPDAKKEKEARKKPPKKKPRHH
jgi:hypothetical protein